MRSLALLRPASLALLASLLAPASPSLATEPLSYSGSATLAMAILYGGACNGFEKKTGKKFTYIETLSGTAKALEKVVEGKVSLAGAGRFLTREEKSRGLVENIIALDGLAIWVNQENPVVNLTRDQAQAIFSGEVLNWKKLGGPDRAIFLVLEPAGAGKATMEVLQAKLLNSRPFGQASQLCEFGRDMILAVSQHPDAICVASQGLFSTLEESIRKKVRKVPLDGILPTHENIRSGRYFLTRPLILATLGWPRGDTKMFIEYLHSPEGMGIVSRNFVPAAPGP